MLRLAQQFLRAAGGAAARTTGRTAAIAGGGFALDQTLLGGVITNTVGSLVNAFRAVADNIGTLPAIGVAAAAIGTVGYLANNLVGGAMSMALTVGAVALGGYALSQTDMGQRLMSGLNLGLEPTA